ncbi:MAG: hypothetical protein ACYDHU_02885 [Acidimicrobiales bacterium]
MPAPPSMFTLPVGDRPPLAPVRDDPAVQTMHEDWRRAHVVDGTPGVARSGMRGAARSRIASVARQTLEPVLRDDRTLIGDVIRGADVVAQRCDTLSQRLADLEALVEEIVRVVSEDVTGLRAALVGVVGAGSSPGLPGDIGSPGSPDPGAPAGDA